MHSDVWEQWHRSSGSSEHSLVRVGRWESVVAAGRAQLLSELYLRFVESVDEPW